MAKSEKIILSDAAKVLRLPPTVKDEKAKGGKKIKVLMQSDLPMYGYVNDATQVYTVSKTTYNKLSKYMLQPWDVVMIAAGDNIGKTHIIDEKLSGDYIATNTIFSIRFGEDKQENATALTMFFNSEEGKKVLNKLITGTTIPRINIKEFNKTKIPSLTGDIKKKSKAAWNNEIKAYEKILEYQNKIEETRKAYKS